MVTNGNRSARDADGAAVGPAAVYAPQSSVGAVVQRESLTLPPDIAIHRWEYVGPTNLGGDLKGAGLVSGRVNCIACDPNIAGVWYLGAPYGGVWKTKDFGAIWAPLTDDWLYLSVSCIAVDPFDSGNVYVGTGDAPGYLNPAALGLNDPPGGQMFGLMQSSDGGRTWRQSGAQYFGASTISAIAIDPDHQGVVFVAEFPGKIWRSPDRGQSWSAVYTATETIRTRFGSYNLPIDAFWLSLAFANVVPGQPRAYYASYTANSATVRAGVATASGYDAAWGLLPSPLRAGDWPVLAASAASADGLFLFSTLRGLVWKGTQNGAAWTSVTDNLVSDGQSTYNYAIACTFTRDPVSGEPVDVVYVGQRGLSVSTTGNGAWQGLNAGHGDQHAITFDPFPGPPTSNVLIGNDGGIFSLASATNAVTSLNQTLQITQFYDISLASDDLGNILGGAQDNGIASLQADGSWSHPSSFDCANTAINQSREWRCPVRSHILADTGSLGEFGEHLSRPRCSTTKPTTAAVVSPDRPHRSMPPTRRGSTSPRRFCTV